MAASPYVIITPAHNEEEYIQNAIDSMARQTVKPLAWVVVDDASTDATAQIVARARPLLPFLELVQVQRSPGRNFGKKAAAFRQGLARVQNRVFEYVGNLDADISFAPDYFARVLSRFAADPALGIAGGMVHSNTGTRFVSQDVALDSVAGAVQLFRRRCFEEVGGYLELPCGGIDSAAEIIARMKGWQVRTFPELQVLEHRWTGTSTAHPIAARMQEGRRHYSLGYAPLFFCLRGVYRMTEPPRIIGSCAALFGYFRSLLMREPIVLPPDVVQFLRAEQRAKLHRLLKGSRAAGAAGNSARSGTVGRTA